MTVMIGAAAQRSGLSVDTIRYYESLGLLVAARNGERRVFSDDDVSWLIFLKRMRETGMPIADLRRYVACRAEGAPGVVGVLDVLHSHQESIRTSRAALDACLKLVDDKIAKYEQLRRVGGAPELDLE